MPDVLTDLTFATDRERCKILAWGYRQVATHFFVHQGAPGIDVPLLPARLSAFDRRPPLPTPGTCARGALAARA